MGGPKKIYITQREATIQGALDAAFSCSQDDYLCEATKVKFHSTRTISKNGITEERCGDEAPEFSVNKAAVETTAQTTLETSGQERMDVHKEAD